MVSRRLARRTLVLLTVLNFFNYVDRQGVYALFPLIREEFGLSDGQLGFIATACLLVLALCAVPGGWLADRFGARIIITGGAIVWTIASIGSSAARSFGALLGARAAVGVGEATYEPAAHATLCALYPDRKSSALAIFNLGTALGIAGGMAIAGVMGHFVGWRITIFALALPGFLLAAMAYRILGQLPRLHDDRPTLKELVKVRSATLMLVIAGGTVAAFTAGGLMAWMPTIVVRYHGFSVWSGGLLLALLAGVGALGALFGGYVGDRAEAKREGGRARAMAIAFACVIPVGTIGLFSHDRATFIALTAVTIFGMAFYAGPIIAVIDDVVPRRYAATGQAAFLLVSHLGGDAIAPAAVGGLADQVGGHDGLRYAALLPIGALGLAVVFFALASKLHARDHAKARALDARVPEPSSDQPALDLG